MYNSLPVKKALFIIFGIFFVLLLLFVTQFAVKQKVQRDISSVASTDVRVSPTPYTTVIPKDNETQSVFVPYWTMGNGIEGAEDRFIYFGISVDTTGINKDDEGYRRLNQFVNQFDNNTETYLTVRMLDQETNFEILEDPLMQDRVISETMELVDTYGFDGVVLDLELKAFPFDSVVSQINEFIMLFYQEAKRQNTQFAVAIYGDTFYRVRPFDVKYIAKNADEMMIMAYDFHKSGGNPGPNFPLHGGEIYGYDYREMIHDFLAVVPPEKLTVIFGMFGYNWYVDDKNISLASGEPLSMLQMQARYGINCSYRNCVQKRDDLSSETTISYIDENDNKHVVWFEDSESVKAKKKFLQERGVNSFSHWAYSYY